MKILKNEHFLWGLFEGNFFGAVFFFVVAVSCQLGDGPAALRDAAWFGVAAGAATALVALWFYMMVSSVRRAKEDD